MKKDSYILKTLHVIYRGSPVRFTVCIFLLIVISFFGPLNLIAISQLTETIAAPQLQLANPMTDTIFFLITMLLLNSKALVNLLGSYLWITAELSLQKALIEKAASKPLLFYDTPMFYKRLERAKEGYGYAISTVMMLISAIFISVFSFVWMTGYLVHLDFSLAAALVLIVCVKIISYILETRSLQALRERQAEKVQERKLLAEYLWCRESRIFGASQFFYNQWSACNEHLIGDEYQTARNNKIRGFVMDTIVYVCYGFAICLAVQSMLKAGSGSIVSGIVVLFVAMESVFSNIDSIVLQCGNVMKNISLSRDLFDFLYEEETQDSHNDKNGAETLFEGFQSDTVLYADHITFHYPQSDTCALHDISLTVKKGEKIAIVGQNGSGKTTLVKILNGLYEPVGGSIYWNLANISTMFQEVCTYNLTLGENIRISDYTKDDITNPAFRLESLLSSVFGDKWKTTFPDGEMTMIGRTFDGIELSGGQKQRLSLARALYKESELVFFDEPTSAIDPLAEDKMIQTILEASKGKTVFFVTHRMSSVRHADKIIVIDKGTIAEQGSHENLMKRNGIYSKMYHAQTDAFFKNISCDGKKISTSSERD